MPFATDFLKSINKTNCNNIEAYIKLLDENITKQENLKCKNIIIQKIIKAKVHYDFIKLLFTGVPKKLEQKKTKPFIKFLLNFNNYFTLNYDPILYYLLNMYKKPAATSGNISQQQQNISEKVRSTTENIITNSKFIVTLNDKKNIISDVALSALPMNLSMVTLRTYFLQYLDETEQTEIFTPTSNFKTKYKHLINDTINDMNAANSISQDLKQLTVYDGFLNETWSENNQSNVFFLHGAFHIKEEEKKITKITAITPKIMMDNIQEYLDKGLLPLTILEGTKDIKLQNIRKNKYLKTCYKKLKTLTGDLVILGVSFADNDNHIKEAIMNNQSLNKIYIGVWENDNNGYPDLENYYNKFKDKDNIQFFKSNQVFMN